MTKPEEIAARRLAALPTNDLHWTMTCDAWRRRLSDDDAAAELLTIAGKMLLTGQRLPRPLAAWLGNALVGAAKETTPIERRATLADRLAVTSPQRRPKHFERAHLRKMLAVGMSQREMAVELDVDRKTLVAWLAEIKLSPTEEADLLQGAAIVRKAFRKTRAPS